MSAKQTLFLDNINKELEEVVALASADYAVVTELFRDYYKKKKNSVTNSNGLSDLEIKIEAMMAGLQYIDIFSQRIKHLLGTHKLMLSAESEFNFKESFFHLQVFQSMTIELDLLRSTSSLTSLLEEVRNALGIKKEEILFRNTPAIKQILQDTIASIVEAAGEKKDLPIPAFTAEQIRLLNSLYTMESERSVLNWFINSMPTGTLMELLHSYEKEINREEIDITEMF